MGIRLARTPDIVPIAKTSGFDWLFIDLEHGAMGLETAGTLCMSALATGVTPLVRVLDPHHATRLLDAGAQGVVVPHVDTVDEAARVIDACLYPPAGHRSIGGPMAQCDYQALPPVEGMRLVNEETMVTVMLETPTAIDHAEAIAALPGLDAMLIGTGDLCVEWGIPGEVGHPRVEQAYRHVLEAGRRHGVHIGMGGAYAPKAMRRYIELGVRMVLSGSDVAFLMAGAAQRSAELRAILDTPQRETS